MQVLAILMDFFKFFVDLFKKIFGGLMGFLPTEAPEEESSEA